MRAGAVQGLLQAGEQLVAGAGQGDVQVRGICRVWQTSRTAGLRRPG